MVKNCCICRAEYGVPKSVTFHRFPKSGDRRQRWLMEINKKIENFASAANAYICSQHFSKDSFVITCTGKSYLKAYAVPTIFNMPLKKHFKINKPLQTYGKFNINYEKLTSNKLQTKIDTAHSGTLDILVRGKEYINIHQQYLSVEKCNIITNIDCEKLYSEKITNVEENHSHKPYASSNQQHIIKLGIMQSSPSRSILRINNTTEITGLKNETESIALKKKIKILQQKCRRLQKRVTFLSLLVKHFQNRKLSSVDAAKLLERIYYLCFSREGNNQETLKGQSKRNISNCKFLQQYCNFILQKPTI